MTATTLHIDLDACRRRTRWTMGMSIVLHALLFLWITTMKSVVVETPPITEILMLEPGDLAGNPAVPSAPAARSDPQPGLASRAVKEDVRFARLENRFEQFI